MHGEPSRVRIRVRAHVRAGTPKTARVVARPPTAWSPPREIPPPSPIGSLRRGRGRPGGAPASKVGLRRLDPASHGRTATTPLAMDVENGYSSPDAEV